MVSLLPLLFKYRYYIIIGLLVITCIGTKYHYNNKYLYEVKQFQEYKLKQSEKYTKDLQAAQKAQVDLQIQYNEEFKKLKDRNEIITSQYNTNKSELNGLYQVLRQNSHSSSYTPTSTLITYNDTLSDLLGTCSKNAIRYAKEADNAVDSTLFYYNLANKQKAIIDEYNLQLNKD